MEEETCAGAGGGAYSSSRSAEHSCGKLPRGSREPEARRSCPRGSRCHALCSGSSPDTSPCHMASPAHRRTLTPAFGRPAPRGRGCTRAPLPSPLPLGEGPGVRVSGSPPNRPRRRSVSFRFRIVVDPIRSASERRTDSGVTKMRRRRSIGIGGRESVRRPFCTGSARPPLQGSSDCSSAYPGRCPGLSSYAPLGLRTKRTPALRRRAAS